MEENNRKGPGVFYAVVGVATLVVAIIGATFAFFSAQASTGAEDIKGQTLDLSGSALTMTAERYEFTAATVDNKNLVPAVIKNDVSGVNDALTANCENGGYTGCHVYKITAGTTESVTAATITLELSVTTMNDNANAADWKYALFEATDSASEGTVNGSLSNPSLLTTIPSGKTAMGSLGSTLSIDLNSNGTTSKGLTGGVNKVVYLMVYLADDGDVVSQNNGDTNDATGSYTGTVTLNAGANGGKVVATFSSQA